MGSLKNEYKSFLDDIEKNIKDKEDLNYIKQRFVRFMDAVLEEMDYISSYKTEQIEALEKSQKEVQEKLAKMQTVLDNIEKDIYSEDGFDFEIICPYCNYEFSVDMDNIEKDEIECPECHNVIELDWNEEHCSGSCSHCMENCVQEDDETYNTNEKDTKKKEDKENKDNNEDDEDM